MDGAGARQAMGERFLKPKLYLTGPFRLESSEGDQVKVSSAKAQAVIAMVATSGKGERGRAWLQSKLWSDRGPEQASGSLRQTLTLLRRVLKPTGVKLDADRRRISLDLDTFDIEVGGGGDFLEGLEIQDPAFQDWVRAERKVMALKSPGLITGIAPPHYAEQSPWSLAIVARPKGEDLENWFEVLFSDALSRSMKEIFSAPVSVEPAPSPKKGQMIVRVQSFFVKVDELAVNVTLEQENGARVWAGNRSVPTKGAPPIEHPELLRLVNELIEAIGDHLATMGGGIANESDPDSLYRIALWRLFSMRPEALVEADKLLERAFDIENRGLFLAWRAQLRAIQSVERHPIDLDTVSEEGKHFCARALELEPGNSMVLATVANSLRRFDRNDQRSFALAQRSVRLNPANPMAWWAMSAAASYAADTSITRDAAVFARRLVMLSPNRFWWDMQRSGPEMLDGNIDEAIRILEQSHAGNPNFRPPLRYLVAHYANKGLFEEAIDAAEKLKELEPDFSIERLIGDIDYPASVIHRLPGLDLKRLDDIKKGR